MVLFSTRDLAASRLANAAASSLLTVTLGAFAALAQGLTLIHFSAQPEPFLTLKISPKPLNTPLLPRYKYPLNTP
jgi:hypothetical protein